MFSVMQIDHVELFVPDRYEAARWYERVLGLHIVKGFEPSSEKGPLMIATREADTKLALFQGEPIAAPQQAAFRRVAFRVSASGFMEFLDRLPELQLNDGLGKILTRDAVFDHQQSYSIYFSDPYGHQLEITTYQYDELSPFLNRR